MESWGRAKGDEAALGLGLAKVTILLYKMVSAPPPPAETSLHLGKPSEGLDPKAFCVSSVPQSYPSFLMSLVTTLKRRVTKPWERTRVTRDRRAELAGPGEAGPQPQWYLLLEGEIRALQGL